ncbi:hypothetical protein AGR7C_Lc160075 [Agrobacterium deltaense Zutra 3/1]|uniref:Uncharacterized protein n=1 Tax=Agrobacterium deltaense Zutra 3/1 TaxID=1183427 RepID=A0A1S7RH45_9HYPH|nr:hypothetical protein AGR7C_Lc160075 [Agrobacterium deltaense Zutra 3/1]
MSIAGVKVRGVKHRIQLLLFMRPCVETPHGRYKYLNLKVELVEKAFLSGGPDGVVLKRH